MNLNKTTNYSKDIQYKYVNYFKLSILLFILQQWREKKNYGK